MHFHPVSTPGARRGARRAAPSLVAALVGAGLGVALASGGAPSVQAAPTPVLRTWTQPAGGWWGDPANWFSAQVPDSSHEWAWLPDFAGACNVLLDHDCTLGGMTLDRSGPTLWLSGKSLVAAPGGQVSNASRIMADGPAQSLGGALANLPGSSLRVRGGSTLTLAARRVDNAGTIYVNDNQANAAATLTFDGADSLAGAGDLWLYNASPFARLDTTPGSVLTNLWPHIVHGLGTVDARLVNQGTLQADAVNNVLTLHGADKTNSGLMQAEPGAWLVLDGVHVDNAGGRIVSNAGTVGLLNNATVAGGTLSTLGAGTVSTLGNARLANVTNQGVMWIRGGDSLAVEGPTFANDGVVYVNSNQANATGRLRFEGNVSLTGNGSLWLYNASPYALLTTSPGSILTQAASHTIHGLGQLDARLVNAGTVKADAANNVLSLHGYDKTNTGSFLATNGGWLLVDGVRVDNSGGRIRAEAGNVQLLHGATIHGGALGSLAGGSIWTQGGARLESVTNQGSIQLHGGDTLTVAGSVFVNDGTLYVNANQAGAIANLVFEGNVLLKGSGSVWLYNASPYARIQSSGGGTLTNAAGHTIRGLGEIRASLVNAGLVRADAVNNSLVLNGSGKTNKGLFKAVGSSWLAIDSVTVANLGGEIQAEGGSVVLAHGARIQNGTLSSGAGGYFYTSANARLEGVRNRAIVRVPGGDTLTLGAGLVTNDGTVVVNYNQSGTPARVSAAGDVSLAGAGDVLLYNAGTAASIGGTPGSVLRNLAGHTIHGVGTIDAHVLNAGTVRADYLNAALSVTDPAFVNTGVVEAMNGGYMLVNDPAAHFAGGTLTGGTWRVHDNSILWINGAAVVTNQAILDLDGPTSRIVKDGALTDALAGLSAIGANGALTLRGGRNLTTAGALTNAGYVVLGKGSVLQVGSPGSAAFTQVAGGAVHCKIGGHLPAELGQLKVSGTANLGGVLAADSVAGFAPALGDTFQVMTFAAHTGAFDHFEAPVVNGLRLTPTVYSNRVVLTAVVPSVDVADLPGAPAALALTSRLGPTGNPLFELAMPAAGHVRLVVFDVRGRLVTTLCDAQQPAGLHAYPLAEPAAGRAAMGPGVYFARAIVTLDTRTESRNARAVLLR